MSANDPAFPINEIVTEYDDSRHEYGNNTHSNPIASGLTKREYFAGLCLQGMMASCSPEYEFKSYKEAAGNAVKLSDALIKALGESRV